MNCRTMLSYSARKDGTKAIKLYIFHDGEKRYISTGLYVLPDQLNAKGQVVKSHPLYRQYNAKIAGLQNEIQAFLLDGGRLSDYGKKEPKSSSILGYLEDFIATDQRLKASTLSVYRSVVKRLREYATYKGLKDLRFSDIDRDWYYSFSKYNLQNGCSNAGLGKYIKTIKAVMRSAQEQGLHDNSEYQKAYFVTHRSSTSHKIFLTEGEIEQIEKLDLSYNPALEKEKDRWLVAYYFLMRFSDVVRINATNIVQKEDQLFLQYKSEKTEIRATVPVSTKAARLLEKYNYDFSFTSNQQANRELKRIASMAGINWIVTQGKDQGPKSQFVTFHTARRSAATNLRLQGASLKTIADLGGWKKLSTLEVYLRASGMDSAILAKKLDFFK
ncbi:site-specific integrase [Phaeodactylibacter xiamenensis]|uniref:site-specific integrase n=1 Tax=Phaeodactylibacter xiamenensis TaxID=1524460 RepID=UPI0024A9A79F|nr:site-specific integrase [Phaeodactylibacter xiamenensis]